jgi:hypothetical protein
MSYSDDQLWRKDSPTQATDEKPQYAYRLNIDNGLELMYDLDNPYTYDECVNLVKIEMYKPDSAENISIERYMLNGDEIISVYDFNRAKWFKSALRYLDLCDLRELVGLSSDQVVEMNELKKYLDFKRE